MVKAVTSATPSTAKCITIGVGFIPNRGIYLQKPLNLNLSLSDVFVENGQDQELAKLVRHVQAPIKAALEIANRRFSLNSSRVWRILCLAVNKFSRINGAQSAAAFSHYAFFSLFPLIVLIVTVASAFINREQAGDVVIAFIENYVPITGEMQRYIFGTITGVIKTRGQAGTIALLMLIWTSMGFFATLIRTTNWAWGTESANWWRLPFKSLGFLGIMVSLVLLGVALPVLAKMAQNWLSPLRDFSAWVYALGSYFGASVIVFLGLSLFYRLAPSRPTRFAEVWIAALCTTVLLQAAESLFLIYLEDFATLNAVYGAFGGIMALLLWIYLSGYIFIFGACLCAAQAESRVVSMKAEKMV